jgi:predicted dithiol-disulfide oxidoreductase (DUF899 family)
MTDHKVVDRTEFDAAREKLIEREKEHTRKADELARQRRELPWVVIEKDYEFDAEDGTRTLAELFDGRSQLLVYHFMFGPTVDGWPEAGCVGCSYTADSLDGAALHLTDHDVTFVAVSSAPLAHLNAYRERMGWRFPWVSALERDFNLDFAVFTEEGRRSGAGFNFGTPKHADIDLREQELHGLSAFVLERGVVYHTYSTYERGVDALWSMYAWLDRAPLGRNETGLWWRRHDEYDGH